MEKSIEIIWKEGFLQEKELSVPVINDIYNQKSQLAIEKILQRMKTEYRAIIPLSFFFFIINWTMGSSIWWGLLLAANCAFWYFIGKRQYDSAKEIHFETNCYDYLVSFREKLTRILNYNLRLILISIPVLLLPMLVYTYYKQEGKTLGEVLGATNLDIHLAFIFLFIPAMMLFAYFFFRFMSRLMYGNMRIRMEMLIQDMKKLKSEN